MGIPEQPGRSPDHPQSSWSVSGQVVLDLALSSRRTVEELEPSVDVRAAADWGGFMSGTLELTDDGVMWVPSDYSRKFGFDAFRLPPDDITDIRVTPRREGGELEIDLTDHRVVAVRIQDPERWQNELDHAIGA